MTTPRATAIRAVVLGTLLAGTLDLVAAILLNPDPGPVGVLQSIASGWAGSAAFEGGATYAALGVLTHFVLMGAIASVWVGLASRLTLVRDLSWPLAGVACGVATWAIMSLIVVPLSAAPFAVADGARPIIQGLIVHVLCVGLPLAWVARGVVSSRRSAAAAGA